jgi:hypothetical protein
MGAMEVKRESRVVEFSVFSDSVKGGLSGIC